MIRNIIFRCCFGLLALSVVVSCSTASSNDNTLAEASFQIEGMTCQMGCAQAIEDKLNSTAGVLEARVIFKDNKCSLSYDSKSLDKNEVIEVVESLGGGEKYKVSEFKIAITTDNQSNTLEEEEGSTEQDQVQVIFKPIEFPNVFEAFLRLN